jgi:hypothetical protein
VSWGAHRTPRSKQMFHGPQASNGGNRIPAQIGVVVRADGAPEHGRNAVSIARPIVAMTRSHAHGGEQGILYREAMRRRGGCAQRFSLLSSVHDVMAKAVREVKHARPTA